MRTFRCLSSAGLPRLCPVGTQREDALWPCVWVRTSWGNSSLNGSQRPMWPSSHDPQGSGVSALHGAVLPPGMGGSLRERLACMLEAAQPFPVAWLHSLQAPFLLSKVMSPQSVALLGALIQPDGSAPSQFHVDSSCCPYEAKASLGTWLPVPRHHRDPRGSWMALEAPPGCVVAFVTLQLLA